MALVGHEPDIGEMAAQLAGLRHRLEFKKGAVCRIDIESLAPPGHGTAPVVPHASDHARAAAVGQECRAGRVSRTDGQVGE